MNEKNAVDKLVSIIIPVYNGSNYMKEAIDSAINQTYKNIEILVINDGSNDDGKTDEIAKSYGDKIRYFKKENGGVSSALNLGIKEMKGEYFSWLSHDDKYSREKIEQQMNSLAKYEYASNIISLCETQQINEKSENIRTRLRKKRFKEDVVITYDKVLKSIYSKGSFNGCALLINKKVFDECGNFDENLRYFQDVYLWEKIFMRCYSIVYTNKKLVYSRVHSQQVTQTKRDLFKNDSTYIAEKIFDPITNLSNRKNNFYYLYVKRNAVSGVKEITMKFIEANKNTKKLSAWQVLKLRIYEVYGRIRPTIRKIYYNKVLGIKTKK